MLDVDPEAQFCSYDCLTQAAEAEPGDFDPRDPGHFTVVDRRKWEVAGG